MRLNQKCPVCGKLHGECDKYCSIKCAFSDENAVKCTQDMDVMMYCPDEKCAYHNAVKEREIEKKLSPEQLQSKLTSLEQQLAERDARIAAMEVNRNLRTYDGVVTELEQKVKELEARLEKLNNNANEIAERKLEVYKQLECLDHAVKIRELKTANAVLEAKLKKLKSFVFVESDFEKTMFELPIVLCRKANTRLKHFIEDHVESITEESK